jgi:hypothetical protein
MGERVTYRNRPRIDSFWVVDNVDTVSNLQGFGRLGPFSPAQMMELWFRVKKVRIQASCDWDDETQSPPATGTASLDVTLYRAKTSDSSFSEITHETELLSEWNANATLGFHHADPTNRFTFTESFPRSALDQDENGDYWLDEGVPGAPIAVNNGADFGVIASGSTGDLTVALEFSDGSSVAFDLDFSVSGSTATSNHAATVEVLEWFPYADKAGSPAWAVATGLQINGGPGA